MASLVLLLGMGAEVFQRPVSAEAEPYHTRVVEASKEMPLRFDDWVGEDQVASRDAINLLKPNVLYNRKFKNHRSGYEVGVLIVHCKDARNLNGHYPPVCYPNMGQAEDFSKRRLKTWVVGDDAMEITGMEYVFGGGSRVVDNFLMIPGRVVPDMSVVTKAAYNVLKRHFGAAQVQVVFSASSKIPAAEQREEIFEMMIDKHMPIIKAIIGDRT